MVYVTYTRVEKLEQKFESKYVSGVGKDTVLASIDLGWFVLYEGSHEFLFIGPTKPEFEVGDRIKLTQEKV